MRHLTFAVMDDGLVLSQVIPTPADGLCVACPVLEYDRIGKDAEGNDTGNFTGPLTYHLEAMPISVLYGRKDWWTKKVPLAVKNEHRAFWGMKPLKPSRRNLPPKQAAILALLDEGPKTEQELAAATGRRPGRALTFLLTLVSKGLVTFDEDSETWRAI